MRFFKISMEKPGDSAMGDSLSDFNGLRETRGINEHSPPLSLTHRRARWMRKRSEIGTDSRSLNNFICEEILRYREEITARRVIANYIVLRFIEILHCLSIHFSSSALIAWEYRKEYILRI